MPREVVDALDLAVLQARLDMALCNLIQWEVSFAHERDSWDMWIFKGPSNP